MAHVLRQTPSLRARSNCQGVAPNAGVQTLSETEGAALNLHLPADAVAAPLVGHGSQSVLARSKGNAFEKLSKGSYSRVGEYRYSARRRRT